MSKLETNTIDNISGSSTLTIGSTNTSTITLKSGATLTNFPDNTPSFLATMSAGQSIAHDTNVKIQFNTEEYDTDGAYDPSTNYRFTVPTGEGGKYMVSAYIRSGSVSDGGKIELKIYKNGSHYNPMFFVTEAAGDDQDSVGVSQVMELSAADYLEVYVLHQSGGAISFSNSASIGSTFSAYKLIGA